MHLAEQRAEGPCGAEMHEQGNAAAAVTGDRCAVATHEPPASASLVGGDRREQAVRVVVLQRNDGKIEVAIEPDGDPRRPTAEPSAAVVQHHGPLQRSRKTFVRVTHESERMF